MARQNADGTWTSTDGSVWKDQGSAGNADRAAEAGRPRGPNAGQGIAGLIPLLVGVAVIAGVVLFLIMVVQNALTMARGQWPYIVVVGLALAVLVVVRIRRKGRKLRTLTALAVAVAVGFALWQVVTAVYDSGGFHFPSAYCADYILALPDGTAPSLYEKRGRKGEVLALLSVDERVTVNGVTSNEREFNITTAEGVTGWVEAAAFPPGAGERPFARRASNGEVTEPVYIDRLVERLAARYLVASKDYPGPFRISQKSLNASVVVQAEAPIFYLDGGMLRNSRAGETVELGDTGDTVELYSVMYADDCTMVFLMAVRDHDLLGWDISGEGNSVAWQTSLTAQDLDTGESWQVLPMKRRYTYLDVRYEGKQQTGVIYFFPPFKSRHFSLTHNNVSALPGKSDAGHGGILAFFNTINIFGSTPFSDYIDWNFAELRVR